MQALFSNSRHFFQRGRSRPPLRVREGAGTLGPKKQRNQFCAVPALEDRLSRYAAILSVGTRLVVSLHVFLGGVGYRVRRLSHHSICGWQVKRMKIDLRAEEVTGLTGGGGGAIIRTCRGGTPEVGGFTLLGQDFLTQG